MGRTGSRSASPEKSRYRSPVHPACAPRTAPVSPASSSSDGADSSDSSSDDSNAGSSSASSDSETDETNDSSAAPSQPVKENSKADSSDSESSDSDSEDEAQKLILGLKTVPADWEAPPVVVDCRNLPSLPRLGLPWLRINGNERQYQGGAEEFRKAAREGDALLESLLAPILQEEFNLQIPPRDIVSSLVRNSVLSVLASAYNLTLQATSPPDDEQHQAADLFEAFVASFGPEGHTRRDEWLASLFTPRVFPHIPTAIKLYRVRLKRSRTRNKLKKAWKEKTGWGVVKGSRAKAG